MGAAEKSALREPPRQVDGRPALLVVFVVGVLFAWRGGLEAACGVLGEMRPVAAITLPIVLGAYVVAANRMPFE